MKILSLSFGLLLAGAVSAFANIKEFSNGCTRTCTGTWQYNQGSDTYTCPGTAGPLDCSSSMGNTQLNRQAAPPPKNSAFNRKGEVVVSKKTESSASKKVPSTKKNPERSTPKKDSSK